MVSIDYYRQDIFNWLLAEADLNLEAADQVSPADILSFSHWFLFTCLVDWNDSIDALNLLQMWRIFFPRVAEAKSKCKCLQSGMLP